MWTRTGTILYSAPEIFEGGGYNEKGKMTIINDSGHLVGWRDVVLAACWEIALP
jgi:hypothetical protein